MEVEQDQQQLQQLTKEHIVWRRSRVLELSSQGRTEREIATILNVGLATTFLFIVTIKDLQKLI
jgi:DNA-binding NarL/FixJ family response regulator